MCASSREARISKFSRETYQLFSASILARARVHACAYGGRVGGGVVVGAGARMVDILIRRQLSYLCRFKILSGSFVDRISSSFLRFAVHCIDDRVDRDLLPNERIVSLIVSFSNDPRDRVIYRLSKTLSPIHRFVYARVYVIYNIYNI